MYILLPFKKRLVIVEDEFVKFTMILNWKSTSYIFVILIFLEQIFLQRSYYVTILY